MHGLDFGWRTEEIIEAKLSVSVPRRRDPSSSALSCIPFAVLQRSPGKKCKNQVRKRSLNTGYALHCNELNIFEMYLSGQQ